MGTVADVFPSEPCTKAHGSRGIGPGRDRAWRQRSGGPTLVESTQPEDAMKRRAFLNALGLASAGTALEPGSALRHLTSNGARLSGMAPVQSAEDDPFWREVQQSFSVSRSVIYLNNAGLCTSPKVVTDAVTTLMLEQERMPSYTAFTTFPDEIENIRIALSRLGGCDAEELAIVRNTTEALQAVILGVPLQAGDEILSTTHDYWAMRDALRQRQQRDGVSVKLVPVPVAPATMDELVGVFERGITSRTRLILVSEMVNLTGQIFPIRRICELAHDGGIEVVVDGAQSFGHIQTQIQDLGCDYYGTSLHKWLMAPKGTGMLYVRRDKIESTWPLLPPPANLESDIRKFEALGTIPSTSLAIGEAIAFHNGIGGDRKEERFRFLTRYWVEKVQDLPNLHFRTVFEPDMSCAIATVDIDGVEPSALVRHLWEEHRILVANASTRADNVKGVRVSPSLHHTLEELDVFCEVLTAVALQGI